MSTEVLSTRALNRAVLDRQLLLQRSTLGLTGALDEIAGIQNQYAPNGYLGLWSRLADFERAHLTEALDQRLVVQGTTYAPRSISSPLSSSTSPTRPCARNELPGGSEPIAATTKTK